MSWYDDMMLVSYDISDNKLRARFSKFLSKFGHRIQYSVFEIDNSDRFIDVVATEIDAHYGKRFEETDSVMVFKMTSSCEIIRYGYARNDEKEIMIVE